MNGMPASVAFESESAIASGFGADTAIPSTFSVTAESISWACFCGSLADSEYFTVTPICLPASSAPFFATAQNESPLPCVMTAIVMSLPWVRSTLSLLAGDPPPSLSSSPPQAAANRASPSIMRSASTPARSPLISHPLSPWSRVGEELDACLHIEHRAASHRWLLTGDRGILLEHEPALVPVGVELVEHLGDARVAPAQGAEQARLRRAHERELTGAVAGGHSRVDVLEVHVRHAVAVVADEGDGIAACDQQVPRVHAPPDVRRRQQPLDVGGALDERAGVRVQRER